MLDDIGVLLDDPEIVSTDIFDFIDDDEVTTISSLLKPVHQRRFVFKIQQLKGMMNGNTTVK